MSTSSQTPTVRSNETLSTLMDCMERIAPLSLADKSFDNVGLLLQSPSPRPGKGVHLCIDLTCAVLEEALAHNGQGQVSTILCYHPIIFRGLKSLTMHDSQQATLLRCAMEGISVFSPHTALDAAPGGINDWLAEGCASSSSSSSTYPIGFNQPPTPCKPTQDVPQGFQNAGMGRRFLLSSPVPLSELVRRVKAHLGLQHVQIATPFAREDPEVQSIAVCAGSGGSVLGAAAAAGGGGGGEDCWLTGELSHHEILACTARGRSVILTNHTNTERGYLSAVLKPRLEELAGDRLDVSVSRVDRDPLRVV